MSDEVTFTYEVSAPGRYEHADVLRRVDEAASVYMSPRDKTWDVGPVHTLEPCDCGGMEHHE